MSETSSSQPTAEPTSRASDVAAWTVLFDRRGFQARLVKRFNLSRAAINQWRGNGFIPVIYCIGVEEECDGEFNRLDFRPEDGHRIWPEFAKWRAAGRLVAGQPLALVPQEQAN